MDTCSDDDDSRLFSGLGEGSFHSSGTADILRIKHNDPEVKSLTLIAAFLGDSAWTRLGHILGESALVELNIKGGDTLRAYAVGCKITNQFSSSTCGQPSSKIQP